MLVEDVDVGEIDEAGGVAVDRTREADLLALAVEPDHVAARIDHSSCRSRVRPFAQYETPPR